MPHHSPWGDLLRVARSGTGVLACNGKGHLKNQTAESRDADCLIVPLEQEKSLEATIPNINCVNMVGRSATHRQQTMERGSLMAWLLLVPNPQGVPVLFVTTTCLLTATWALAGHWVPHGSLVHHA